MQRPLRGNSLSAVLAAARAGHGLAALPWYVARESVADGSLRPVLEGYALPSQELHAVYPSPKLVPSKVAGFIALLQAALDERWWEGPTSCLVGVDSGDACRALDAKASGSWGLGICVKLPAAQAPEEACHVPASFSYSSGQLVDISDPLQLAWSGLLLELYRAARELSVAEFPGFAFGHVAAILRFDAGRYTALKFLDPGAVVCTSHVWNDATDTVVDWEQINRHDAVVPTVLAAPGRAFSFHQRTLFAGPGKAIMRDFIERTEHRNNLVIALRDDGEGLWKSLSRYRAGADDRYMERDRLVLQALMPHVVEALRINESLGALAARADADGRASLAVAGLNGALHYVGPRFVELMRLE